MRPTFEKLVEMFDNGSVHLHTNDLKCEIGLQFTVDTIDKEQVNSILKKLGDAGWYQHRKKSTHKCYMLWFLTNGTYEMMLAVWFRELPAGCTMIVTGSDVITNYKVVCND
jgi:hypothetical protein